MILAIIPARFASTRFPGKPLADIGGKTMIQRVWEQVGRCAAIDRAVVATDDARIFDRVHAFGGEAMMTRADHPSGTDRCAEVARKFPQATYILNVQGDEPFIQPAQLDTLIQTLNGHPKFSIATLAKKITQPEILFDPNSVKVVFSPGQGALYFSRHPVPFLRGVEPAAWLGHQTAFYKHIGLYGFRRAALLRLAKLRPSPLERAESLEQLRWLEHGWRIAVGVTELETIGIDTPEDLLKIKAL